MSAVPCSPSPMRSRWQHGDAAGSKPSSKSLSCTTRNEAASTPANRSSDCATPSKRHWESGACGGRDKGEGFKVWQFLPMCTTRPPRILPLSTVSKLRRLAMRTLKSRRATASPFVAAILGAAIACGGSPTAAPQTPRVAHDEQLVCIVIDTVRYCTEVTATAGADTAYP